MVPEPSTATPGETRSRRAVLAATGAAGVALAGCSSLRRRRLSSSVEHGDGELHVDYTAAGSAVATASFLVSPPVDGRVRFRPHLSQDLSGVESYRLRFRPVVDGSVPGFTVAFERPGGYPLTVDFRFDLLGPVERLRVQVEMHATLDAGLDPRAYVAEALLTVHGPRGGER
jgi:hypothetical protein